MDQERRAADRPSRPAAAPGPEGPGPSFPRAAAALAAALLPLHLPEHSRPWRLTAKPRVELIDCRSLTVKHEVPLAEGAAWKLGETEVSFSLEREKWTARVRASGASERTVTLSKLPSLLEIEAGPGGRGPYGLSVRASADGKGLLVSSAQGAPVPLGKETALVVDSDRDGVLGSAGDGVVVPGVRTVAPFAGELWHRDAAAGLRRADGGGPEEWLLFDLPMPCPENGDHAAAWRLVQWRRQQAGMRPLRYDAALEDGLRKHASYCRRNSFRGHEEDRARQGFTPEGAEAGLGSVLNYPFGSSTFLQEAEVQLSTLYHRNQVLAGGLVRSAMVRHEGMFGMRTSTDPEAGLLEAAVAFPPHGMEDAPRRFHPDGEIPAPWEGSLRNPGVAVSILLPALHWNPDLPSPPELVVEGPRGPVAGRFHHPGRAPKGVPKDNFGNVALVPSEPLPPLTLFQARVRVALPELEGGGTFEYRWEFTTGR